VAAFDKFLGLKRKVSDVEKMANEPQKKRRKSMKTTFHSDDTRNDDSNYLSFPLHKETVQAVNVRRPCVLRCAWNQVYKWPGAWTAGGQVGERSSTSGVDRGSCSTNDVPPGGGTWENWK